MKKILNILVTVLTFTMVASVANAQMHSVGLKKGGMLENGYANARPATGETDNDYPSVRWLINNAKVPTIGELKQEIYQYCIERWGKNPFLEKDNVILYRIYDYTSNGRGNYTFKYLVLIKGSSVGGAPEHYLSVQHFKYSVDPKRAKWGKPIVQKKRLDPLALDPNTGKMYSHDVFAPNR